MVTHLFKTVRLGFGLMAAAAMCSAAGAVASITSVQPFMVDGVQLANPGVNSWPLITNDEVSTTAGAALMTFRDGSAVKLAPQSRVRLAGTVVAPQVILIAGNVDTKLTPGSKLLVTRDPNGDGSGNGAPDYGLSNTGARANTNIGLRKAVFIWGSTGLTLAGLGVATDALLQPTTTSIR
jgi:hypothetical protein